VTTQASLSAQMIEGLHLAGGDHVLDVMPASFITNDGIRQRRKLRVPGAAA
jgi:hypothetical protein